MIRVRLAAVLCLLALLVAAAPAAAQDGNPFNGLPPAQPTPAPTVQQPTNPTSQNDGGGRTTLYLIGAGLLIVFVGIGVWIARDARRALPPEALQDRRRDEGPHRHERQAKAKARAKGRAQRQARKAGRKKARR